jgi:hypothetical protein
MSDLDNETSVATLRASRIEGNQFEAVLSKVSRTKWRRRDEKASGKGKNQRRMERRILARGISQRQRDVEKNENNTPGTVFLQFSTELDTVLDMYVHHNPLIAQMIFARGHRLAFRALYYPVDGQLNMSSTPFNRHWRGGFTWLQIIKICTTIYMPLSEALIILLRTFIMLDFAK